MPAEFLRIGTYYLVLGTGICRSVEYAKYVIADPPPIYSYSVALLVGSVKTLSFRFMTFKGM